ncbi:DUF3168 domain-containing protein [Brevundimonas sp.]|jgi:hypothetical protein|uniref:DUF3168 domain-containing protein n=1 Tax=Brevundimonas sp. TaxID=1871086 RepID=UPI002E155DA4|nr:DUF3168 domain-containing protein [Brevundimonas sp.]
MSAHEAGLIRAVIARLKADAGVDALLAGRVWDEAPVDAALPHIRIGRGESRPVGAEGCGVEQALTLTAVSGFRGSEEARAILAAVRACLTDVSLEADGVKAVSARVTFSDVFSSPSGERRYAVMRLRAVTEEV